MSTWQIALAAAFICFGIVLFSVHFVRAMIDHAEKSGGEL